MIDKILDGDLMPHGHCYLWRYDLMFLHLVGDVLTFVSYFVIPIGLIYFVKKREDLMFNWIFMMFAAFILLCGITHVFGVINIWHGYYFLEGLVKIATGIVSITTAIMLWYLMPKALAIPSNAMLEERNSELVMTKSKLEESNRTLEQRVMERTRELAALATTDSLTGLLNHAEILKQAEYELNRSIRYTHEFSVLMLDIDHFKSVNDEHGHRVGDRILLDISNIIKDSCRHIDKLGRYGGEEFLIICPETDKSSAFELAERIRIRVEEMQAGIVQNVTCSIGVASYINEEHRDDLINAADKALYRAKKEGRNRVVTADDH